MADAAGITLALEVASGAGLAVGGALLFFVRTRRAYTLILGAFLLVWSGHVIAGGTVRVLLLLGEAAAALPWLWAHLVLGTVAYVPLAYVAASYPVRRGPAKAAWGLPVLALPAVLGLVGLAFSPAAFHPGLVGLGSPDPRGATWRAALFPALMWAAFYAAALGLARYHGRAATAPERRRAAYVLSALLVLVGFHAGAQVAAEAPVLPDPEIPSDWVRLAEGLAGLAVAAVAGGATLLREARRRRDAGRERTLLAAALLAPPLLGAANVAIAPTVGFDATGLWRLAGGLAFAYAVIWFEAFDLEVKVVRGAVAGMVFGAAALGAFGLHAVVEVLVGPGTTALAVAQAVLFGALLVALLSARSGEGLLHRVMAAIGEPQRLERRRLEVYEAALAQAVAEGALASRQGWLRDLRDRLGISSAEHQLLVQLVDRGGAPGATGAAGGAGAAGAVGTAGGAGREGAAAHGPEATGPAASAEAAPTRGRMGPFVPLPAFEPGETVGGRYRLEERLGEGAFGRALLATDEAKGRPVVVKALKMPREGRQEAVRDFLREARLAGGVDHPNVVRVLDLGVAGDTPYLVTEHVEGGTLRERIAREGRLEPSEAVAVMTDILDGLTDLHGRGIVHRDLKPANVLLAADGRAKIADLGIAVRPDPEETTTGLGRVGMPVGTPATMSPEVVRGEAATPAADLYAAGAVLYEALAGRPYLDLEGKTAYEMRQAILHHEPKPLPDDVDRAMARVVQRALAKEPDRRFPSAKAMRDALLGAAA